MNSDEKRLTIGVLVIITGIITLAMSQNPSRILQYIFIAASSAVGELALLTGQNAKGSFVRSKYYTFIAVTLIVMAISVGIWATTLAAFIEVIGLFLLVLGVIEFVFVLQILGFETPTPWKVLALKLGITAVVATGAAWILTMAGLNVNLALFAAGALLVFVGLSFMKLSWMEKSV